MFNECIQLIVDHKRKERKREERQSNKGKEIHRMTRMTIEKKPTCF